jgi:anti-sigma regulatory factor (Ser/Thr protein kinase)
MQGSFERDLAALESVFRFTEEFTVANKVNKSVSFAMNVAIEELFTNIVKYSADDGSEISIHLAITGDDLVVKITAVDNERFDITTLNKVDLDKSLDERKIGGIGLHLVRSFVDKITYDYQDGAACIELVKHLGEPDV